jgi:hypothetical protein
MHNDDMVAQRLRAYAAGRDLLFIQRVLDDAATAADVLEEGFERYEHAVIANYHRLKTVDNVYRQRSAILQRLDAIDRDDSALANA